MTRLFYIMIFLPFLLSGQKNSLGIDFKLISNSLLNSGIDTFFIYKDEYVGDKKSITINHGESKETEKEKWCDVSDVVLVMYRNKGGLFLKKYNECYEFKPIKLDTSKAFSYLINYFDTIKVEKILPNTIEITKSGDTLVSTINHRRVTNFYFNLGPKHLEIEIDWYCFAERSISYKNIFWAYNNSLKIKIFDDLFTKETTGQQFEKQ